MLVKTQIILVEPERRDQGDSEYALAGRHLCRYRSTREAQQDDIDFGPSLVNVGF